MSRLAILLIKLYRYLISPYIGQHCRFTPSCSSYAMEALEKYGIVKGSWLSLRRLAKCHPWHEGGYDPVPHCEHHPDHG